MIMLNMSFMLPSYFLVFGWRDGSTFVGTERRDPYNLQVGFIKGTQLSYSELTVNVISGTAGECITHFNPHFYSYK